MTLGCTVLLATLLHGCDKKTEEVSLELEPLRLVGNGNSALFLRTTTPGNPSCVTIPTSIDELLENENLSQEVLDVLDTLSVDGVNYQITQNSTASDIIGSVKFSDPESSDLVDIAEVNIPAGTTITQWTPFPFVENGANVLQFYLDNRDNSFSYCAEGILM